jgi:hypothetical protein
MMRFEPLALRGVHLDATAGRTERFELCHHVKHRAGAQCPQRPQAARDVDAVQSGRWRRAAEGLSDGRARGAKLLVKSRFVEGRAGRDAFRDDFLRQPEHDLVRAGGLALLLAHAASRVACNEGCSIRANSRRGPPPVFVLGFVS